MPIAHRLVARGSGLPAKLQERTLLLRGMSARRGEASSAGMNRRALVVAACWAAVGGTASAGASADAVLGQIDSFGFHSRLAMGVGGFLTANIHPVVLFRDGRALLKVEALAYPAGLDAHRRARPADWTRWRRNGGVLEIEGSKGWAKLAFQTTYPKLPDGFRLGGRFRRLGGTGTVAVGGGDSMAAWSEYQFSGDGRVSRSGGAGVRAEAGGGSVTANGAAPLRSGTYRIDGLALRIRWSDGGSDSHILVTDPRDPKSAIWLDGHAYARRQG